MADQCLVPYSLIPLSSEELLWEWDIVSDSVFLSQGALKKLNLEARPRRMAEFYSLLPADAAVELASTREGVISGKAGSSSECGYLCNGFWVQEHVVVLTRNSEGRATRIMGHMTATSMQKHMGFRGGQALLSEAGMWIYDVKQHLIWHDRICEKILGQEPRQYPIKQTESIMDVHPTEQDAIRRHYQLFCSGQFLGDTITDIVRVRISNGEYMPVLVRATAMQRDEQGRALLISGLMAPGEPQIASLHSLHKDDHLFHALNSMGSGQWNWDTKQNSIYFCPRYMAMLGYQQDDDAHFAKNWRNYVHPDDLDKINKVQEQTIVSPDHGDTYECTYRMKRADGGWAWIFDRGCVTWRDSDGRAGHMVGSITNITTAQAERDKLEELVRHDTLTGLRSRAFCNLEIEHIEQNDIRPVSVISVDITGLKMVNDYLGHSRGDELLTQAATIMRGALRRSDCIGRVGGDEFIVLLPGCDYEKGKKVRDKLEAAFKAYNNSKPPLPVYAAIGLASTDTMDDSIQDILTAADDDMYADKRQQRKEAHASLKAIIRETTGQEVGADVRLVD